MCCRSAEQSIHFVQPDVKVDGQYYRDTLPMQGLLPEISEVSSSFFTKTMCRRIGLVRQSCYWKPGHQTSFHLHYGHRTVRTWVQWTRQSGQWCKKRFINIESKTFGKLRECIVSASDELDQRHDWHGSQAVANSSSRLRQSERWLLWTQPALINFD